MLGFSLMEWAHHTAGLDRGCHALVKDFTCVFQCARSFEAAATWQPPPLSAHPISFSRKVAANVHKSILVIAAILVLSTASYWTTLAQVSPPRPQALPLLVQEKPATPRIVDISAKRYEFTPNEIHVKTGEEIELRVHSVDDTHGVKLDLYPEGAKDKQTPGLRFDSPDQNGKVRKGVDQVLDFTAVRPGTYAFKCAKVCGMGHKRMKGKLIAEN